MPKPKTNKTKKKMGAPSKFDQYPETLLAHLYTEGKTDKEVAELLGVTEQTINNWKKARPDFFEALKDWKAQADKEVEKSLYERACGYSHPDTKPQWVNDDSGGHWEYAEMIKHYPPDSTSMIFWLKNRQPEKWRDKKDIDVPGGIKIEIVQFDCDNTDPE